MPSKGYFKGYPEHVLLVSKHLFLTKALFSSNDSNWYVFGKSGRKITSLSKSDRRMHDYKTK